MGSPAKRDGPRASIFPDGQPRRVADVDTVVGDTSEEERKDGEKGPSPIGDPPKREVTGEPLDWSVTQKVQAVLVSAWFWEIVDYLEQNERSRSEARGRKRLHSMADWAVLWVSTDLFGGGRQAARQINDAQIWWLLRRALEVACPDESKPAGSKAPARRLSKRPISRSQFDYFRKHCLNEQDIQQIKEIVERASGEQALHIGIFDPSAGSLTHPDKSQGIAGDATWLKTMCDIVIPTDANRSKFDPGAIAYHNSDERFARGRKLVAAVSRTRHRQERIIHAFDRLPEGVTEDDQFYEQVRRLCERHPEILLGLYFTLYDMAQDSENCDLLLSLGIVPISRVRRTSKGKAASMNLGPYRFAKNGLGTELIVTAVDGAACLAFLDGTGAEWWVPLKLVQVHKRPQTGHTLFYIETEIPDDDLVPEDLVGARTLIRVNSSPEEAEADPHRRRSRALRIFPEEVSEQCTRLVGGRQDIESEFSKYKSDKRDERSRVVGDNNFDLGLLAHQLNTNITAIVAHHNRTGAEITEWFGQLNPLDSENLIPAEEEPAEEEPAEEEPAEEEPAEEEPAEEEPAEEEPARRKSAKQKSAKQKSARRKSAKQKSARRKLPRRKPGGQIPRAA